jgi:hypothetical protein
MIFASGIGGITGMRHHSWQSCTLSVSKGSDSSPGFMVRTSSNRQTYDLIKIESSSVIEGPGMGWKVISYLDLLLELSSLSYHLSYRCKKKQKD